MEWTLGFKIIIQSSYVDRYNMTFCLMSNQTILPLDFDVQHAISDQFRIRANASSADSLINANQESTPKNSYQIKAVLSRLVRDRDRYFNHTIDLM